MPSSAIPILQLSMAALAMLTFKPIQAQPQPVISGQGSWPHVYPGMPTGDYSPKWQSYFQVTEDLPDVNWPLPRNWAGNIPVQRIGHPNNTLFFWAFESSDGSFTANSSEPWGIWLNGGPGVSSLYGLFFENGPIHIQSDYTIVPNQHSWNTIADYVWIDQPVGTGFSTVDADGLVTDEDQLGADFMGFLENLVKVFPNLATRPLYLTGESYAGTYIPYITKTYFAMDDPPVRLAGIAIGDGAITNIEAATELPVVSVLETYPQIIGYDTEVFEYFKEQSELCGYNLTLQYPQPEHFPTINAPISFSSGSSGKSREKLTKRQFLREAEDRFTAKFREADNTLSEHRVRARDIWKRDLADRANGTIDPAYLCDLCTEMIDYALNYTFPWSLDQEFDPYNIPDALSLELPADASIFLNDEQTRSAIHAPTIMDWMEAVSYVFEPTGSYDNPVGNPYGDPSVEPMAFLTELATNATAHGISVTIYSGNDDSLLPHLGSQVAIQNTTFGGIQGFTRKPATPWYNDAGEFAGIVHQERGWKYVLVARAGHLLGYTNPISALTLAREFIFGNNQTGLVTNTSSKSVTVIGGEVTSLAGDIMTGQPAIYYNGQGTATSSLSYIFPSATVEAWNAYMAAAAATATSTQASSAILTSSMSHNKLFILLIVVFGNALVTVMFKLL